VEETKSILLIAGGLFVAFLACVEIGYRVGWRDRERERSSISVVLGAVFGLLALLLAFSFGTGIAHFDHRRQLIVDEAKALNVAYRRVSMLPASEQPEMRALFRRYVDARLGIYRGNPDAAARHNRFDAAESIADQIWTAALRDWNGSRSDALRLFIPALNDMFNLETEREVAENVHSPTLVLVLLIIVGLMSSLLAGYTMVAHGARPVLLLFVYPIMLALTIYAVIDLDDPRSGVIRVDAAEQALIQQRDWIEKQTP
jgi:hypothetical protein